MPKNEKAKGLGVHSDWYENFCKLLIDLDPELASTGREDTFAYVIFNCHDYGGITKRRWKESTQNQYADYYKTYLIPGLSMCPMTELTEARCEQLLEDIQEKRRKNSQRPFSYTTINQLRYLIRLVFDKAVEMGVLMDNCLWGSPKYVAHVDSGDRDIENANERVVLRKSLTPNEEKRIYDMLLRDPTQHGYMMALAMMFSLGLRNAEACGVKFGSLTELPDYPGNYALYIAITTIGNTSELKVGGKTSNSPRKLPVPNSLATLILKRRDYLENMILAGEIVLGEGQNSVEDLPIACISRKKRGGKDKGFIYEDDFTTSCRSGDLTRYGKSFLATIGVDESEVAYIGKEMDATNSESDFELIEKDPTVYLFRRNLGTHLSLLGLSQTEIEAVMGHKITDDETEKNDLENDDRVYQIKKKMDERPFFNDDPPSGRMHELSNQPFTLEATADCYLKITLKKGLLAHLKITACEQRQNLKVIYNAQNSNGLSIERCGSYVQREKSEHVSIIKAYRTMYQ